MSCDKSTDADFLEHLNKKPKLMGNQSQRFFTPQQNFNKEKISWLKLQPGEELDRMPSQLVKKFISHARENVFPVLSDEAKVEIRTFFLKLRELTIGVDSQTVTFRQLEALMRLTMARARADMMEVATKEHAVDVINLFKFTMPDLFADLYATEGIVVKRHQSAQCSSMSKPKQMKAFIDHLRDSDQDEYTGSELKNIAKEMGIRDYTEIIERLNHAGEILKTVNGYRVID